MTANPYGLYKHLSLSERDRAEMEIDFLRWESAREYAEDLVKDLGWSKNDEDYWFQVEEETKRQFDEDLDRERWKRGDYDDM